MALNEQILQDYFQAIFNGSNRSQRRDMLFHSKNRLFTKKGYRNGRRLAKKR